jgi:hypothetical protein
MKSLICLLVLLPVLSFAECRPLELPEDCEAREAAEARAILVQEMRARLGASEDPYFALQHCGLSGNWAKVFDQIAADLDTDKETCILTTAPAAHTPVKQSETDRKTKLDNALTLIRNTDCDGLNGAALKAVCKYIQAREK